MSHKNFTQVSCLCLLYHPQRTYDHNKRNAIDLWTVQQTKVMSAYSTILLYNSYMNIYPCKEQYPVVCCISGCQCQRLT